MLKPPSPLRHAFRALRHRNFRLFLAGQFVSNLGTWGQSVALGWLLYRLTGSKLVLGLSSFLAQIPAVFLSPLAGVVADRWNRHRLVITTQTVAMIQAFGLAALVLSGHAAVVPVLAFSLLLGLANAADVPARQSFIVEMTGAEDLPNAIALNSSVFNLARLVGPAVAGPLIATIGEGHVFLLNGVSYFAVIAALLAMRLPPAAPRAAAEAELWAHLREGFGYVSGFRPIRAILLLLAMVSLLGTPNMVLLPAFARDVFHGDAHTLSYLVSSVGVGALVGAMYMASRRSVRGLSLLIVVAVTLFGASLVGVALAPSPWVASVLLAVTGFGMMTTMASMNTMLQTMADPSKRGRVMSFFTVAFMGTAPIGGLVLGAVADRIGAQWTTGISGAVCLVAAAVFARARPALRDQIRPIYARLGVIPEVAEGLRAGDQGEAAPR